MILFLIGVAVPCIATFLCLRRWTSPTFDLLFCVALACAFGMAGASVTWWGLLHLPLPPVTRAVVDVAFWVLVGVFVPRMRPPAAVGSVQASRVSPSSCSHAWRVAVTTWAALLLAVAAAVAVVGFVASSVVIPHGEWDAWMIWNMRARDFYRSDPFAWRAAFTLATHADYPLLAPLFVARGWVLLGDDDPIVPIAFAAVCGLLVAVIAGLAVAQRGTAAKGLLTAALILATPSFVEWWPLQGTDIATSLYVLMALILYARAREPGAPAALGFLVGAAAACAAWTKNEGLAFCAVAGLVWLLTALFDRSWVNRWSALGLMALGALPVLGVVAAFKWSIPVSNDLVASQSLGRAMTLLSNGARVRQVVTAFAHEVWTTGATGVGTLPVMVAFAAIVGVDRRRIRVALPIIGVIVAMAGLDVLVYVLTPLNLTRHLQSSLDRVVLQLAPSAVWVGMWLTGRSETPPMPSCASGSVSSTSD